MSDPTDTIVVYEQPLSERIRGFLRLEFLFQRSHHMLQWDDVWASRGALESINDIMSVVSRSDLKKELISELDRHAGTLRALSRNPKVDAERLSSTLNRVDNMLTGLKRLETAPGLELREHELLSAVRQRSSIPAGTCDFDLPNFHFWLRSTPQQRQSDLHRWLGTFSYLQEATELCLELVRESALASNEVAVSGFFQKTLESNSPCQMIRVAVDERHACYPEISAGRHRFTVRFMVSEDPATRATQASADIAFRLLRCVI